MGCRSKGKVFGRQFDGQLVIPPSRPLSLTALPVAFPFPLNRVVHVQKVSNIEAKVQMMVRPSRGMILF